MGREAAQNRRFPILPPPTKPKNLFDSIGATDRSRLRTPRWTKRARPSQKFCQHYFTLLNTLCYAIMLPGRKSGFRAGFRPDYNRENLKIGSPAGLRPAGGPILGFSQLESRFQARKHYCVTWGIHIEVPAVLEFPAPQDRTGTGPTSSISGGTPPPMQSQGRSINLTEWP